MFKKVGHYFVLLRKGIEKRKMFTLPWVVLKLDDI